MDHRSRRRKKGTGRLIENRIQGSKKVKRKVHGPHVKKDSFWYWVKEEPHGKVQTLCREKYGEPDANDRLLSVLEKRC